MYSIQYIYIYLVFLLYFSSLPSSIPDRVISALRATPSCLPPLKLYGLKVTIAVLQNALSVSGIALLWKSSFCYATEKCWQSTETHLLVSDINPL